MGSRFHIASEVLATNAHAQMFAGHPDGEGTERIVHVWLTVEAWASVYRASPNNPDHMPFLDAVAAVERAAAKKFDKQDFEEDGTITILPHDIE